MNKSTRVQFAGLIPARYASSRFPGKPLVMIGDRSMVMRVYQQALASLDIVWVATDDQRIFDAVRKEGGNVIMTSSSHMSGTDRCAEAARLITTETGKKIDVVLNIQGDEPFIKPEQLDQLKGCFSDPAAEIATLVRRTAPGEDIFNPNHVKVVTDLRGYALYFSRSAIPYLRDAEKADWSSRYTYFKHLGLYAYRTDTLEKITKLGRSSLEMAESLEQNRWLENGFRIKTAVTEWETVSVDTPEDLERALRILDEKK